MQMIRRYIFTFEPENQDVAIERIECCIQEVRQWMAQNFLKLNDEKTELNVLDSQHNFSKLDGTELKMGDINVKPSQQVCNTGAVFDMQSCLASITSNRQN